MTNPTDNIEQLARDEAVELLRGFQSQFGSCREAVEDDEDDCAIWDRIDTCIAALRTADTRESVEAADQWDIGVGDREQTAEFVRDNLPASGVVETTDEIRIVCDWRQADPFPRFIEAETPSGVSISLPWFDRPDGCKELRIPSTRSDGTVDEPIGQAFAKEGEGFAGSALLNTALPHGTPVYLRPQSANVFVNDGNAEDRFVEDGRNLNCPACGGSGYVDDAKAGA